MTNPAGNERGSREYVDPVRSHGLNPETAPELQFASSLSGKKRSHRIIAIVLLLIFILPLFLAFAQLL